MKRLLILIFLFAAGRRASAEDAWSEGVPMDRQQQANALFAEANQLFAQQAHAPALEKYKAAIALWDHPLIRFNMAVTEIRLDRILDAAGDLDLALRFGQTPFSKELYGQALDYQALVKKQVGDVEASCDQQEVQVLLDGKPWFQCPGTQKRRVLAGEHVIVGERKEYITRSRRLVVAGGAVATEKLSLVPIEIAVVLEYPYPRWVPFTIAGSGAAVALGGLAVWFAGRNQMDEFHADFALICPTGCDAALDANAEERMLADERDSARLKGKIGISLMSVGGAAAIGGVVMVILNRPRRVLPNVEIAPVAQRGMAVRVGWRF